jgi:hypothetical protein
MGGNKAIIPTGLLLGILRGCQSAPDPIRKHQNLPIKGVAGMRELTFIGSVIF